MEQVIENKRCVELDNYFEGVWASLWRVGEAVSLETECSKTVFVVKAKMAKRFGITKVEEVIVFLRSDCFGNQVECSRCYACDWGLYFNHLGRGQRIGMYCKAVDSWVSRCRVTVSVDYF